MGSSLSILSVTWIDTPADIDTEPQRTKTWLQAQVRSALYFSLSEKVLRNFATFGATTNAQ